MKDDEMKGECATNGKEERGIQDFGLEACWKEIAWRRRCTLQDNIQMDIKNVTRAWTKFF